MEPSETGKSMDKSSTDKKIKRTNPAKLLAIGLLKQDQIAKDVIALSQDAKLAKVPLRNHLLAAATTKKLKPGDIQHPNVMYVPRGTKTGIFKKGARASLSAIDEEVNEEDNHAAGDKKDDPNATI